VLNEKTVRSRVGGQSSKSRVSEAVESVII
jgi:hypothetical protein